MTLEELIIEAELISKPCYLLSTVPNDDGIVGYWGGSRSDMPEALDPVIVIASRRKHIFTLSDSLLARIGVRAGPVSLFEWSGKGNRVFRVEADYRLSFGDLSFNGQPLYASESTSFPPLPALCVYGSRRVEDWLADMGLARHEYWKLPRDIECAYDRAWAERSHFHRSEADIVVGGWHFLWPEDDYYVPQELRLVALSLRDAEPWHELWFSPISQGWRSYQRIT